MQWACAAGGAAAAAAAWLQHRHYLTTRREVLGDAQPLLYGAAARHVAVLLKLREGGEDLFDAMRRLRYTVEGAGGVFVYAGKARQVAAVSEQVANEWDGVAVLQLPSAAAWAALRGGAAYAAATAGLARSYHCVWARSALTNLAIPQVFLAMRAQQALRGERILPFTKASAEQLREGVGKAAAVPRDTPESRGAGDGLGDEPVVVLNLVRHDRGTPEGAAAAKSTNEYSKKMMAMLAAAGTGPTHVGRAEEWDGGDSVRWNLVALMHYPSRRFTEQMFESTYFNSIIGGKKTGPGTGGDSLAIMTAPMARL